MDSCGYSDLLGNHDVSDACANLSAALISSEHGPGSLRDPAPTDLFPSHGFVKLGTVIGLLISGVSYFSDAQRRSRS